MVCRIVTGCRQVIFHHDISDPFLRLEWATESHLVQGMKWPVPAWKDIYPQKIHFVLQVQFLGHGFALLFLTWKMYCCCSAVKSCPTLCNPHGLQHTRLPCPPLSPSLLKVMLIESVIPFNCLILCRPLLLLSSIFPSIRVLSNDQALHIRWPKYWSFSWNLNASQPDRRCILRVLIWAWAFRRGRSSHPNQLLFF